MRTRLVTPMSDIPDEWPARIADQFGPHAGPCAFCGHHDKRHRLIDSVVGAVLAGDSVEDTADDMDLNVQTVQAAVDYARSASD